MSQRQQLSPAASASGVDPARACGWVHGLPAKVVAVHHHTEAFLAALLPGQALGGEEDMACQRPVCLGQVLEGGNVPFRDDQEVHRRLRIS